MKRVACLVSLLFCAGCVEKPPIETFTDKLVTQAIVPVVKQGLAQGVKALTIQAGAQAVNPTYAIEFEAKWVVGVEGRATIGVEGLSGQVQITSVSDDETETSP